MLITKNLSCFNEFLLDNVFGKLIQTTKLLERLHDLTKFFKKTKMLHVKILFLIYVIYYINFVLTKFNYFILISNIYLLILIL